MTQANQVLEWRDPELVQHFRAVDVKLGDYLWNTWTNLYTDILPKSDWLILFDHLVAFPEYPELFILLAANELIVQRDNFLSTSDTVEVASRLDLIKIENIKVSLRRVVDLVYEWQKAGCPEYTYKRAIPLQKRNYQAFMFLPKGLL